MTYNCLYQTLYNRVMSTITQTLQQATAQLSPTSDTARLDAEILLAFVLNENRTYLFTWPEKQITADQEDSFTQLLKRRLAGEPIAYIVGTQEFWSLSLKVTPDTLIPRPETELLVELALQQIPDDAQQNILDLGTGSGAIALAMAKERPACRVTGIDQSKQALIVAEDNARNLQITNVQFQQGHWLRELDPSMQFDVIVSNPPYIASHDPHLFQGDVRFEPDAALASGIDGLNDIREIAVQARALLPAEGWLFLEHGYDQSQAISELLAQLGYKNITDHNDLANLPRVVAAQYAQISN